MMTVIVKYQGYCLCQTDDGFAVTEYDGESDSYDVVEWSPSFERAEAYFVKATMGLDYFDDGKL